MQTNEQATPRRVGTFTMGIALIVSGILLCLSLVFPSLQLLFLLRFSPLFLVLLGAEILFAARTKRPLRYDWLSMLLCGFLIACASGATCVAAWMQLQVAQPF